MSSRTRDREFSQRRLDGWKSIAEHLDRSCRTIQRWNEVYGLPVHHLGGDKSPVFAYADQLDDWMRNRGQDLMDEPPEIPGSLPYAPLELEGSDHRNGLMDGSLISGSARARSAELVALAYEMWEVLSYDNIHLIARRFREAIDLDPHNAQAFAGLAQVLITDGLWENLGVSGRYASAQAAVEKALEINPELLEAKNAAAWLKVVLARDWQGARRGFDEILSHNPAFRSALLGRGMLHVVEGCFKEASVFLLKAALQAPLCATSAKVQLWSKYLAGEYAQTLDEIKQMRASGQTGTISNAVEALALIQLEEPGACISRLEVLTVDSPHNDVLRGALGYVYAVTGQGRRANELLDVLANPGKSGKIHAPYAIALVLIGLNQRQEAVQRLEQSYREGSLWSLGFLSDPILASLRNDPHFRLFLSKVSYPVAENAAPSLGFAG